MAAAAGKIDLSYGDESGCSPWSDPSYSYYFNGQQKRIEQTKRQGKRVNIMGFFQKFGTFFYGIIIGKATSKTFIKLIDEQARLAEEVRQKTGRIRVIVLDNYSIHKSKEVQSCWSRWEEPGLYFFFLPSYCSEMNPIELEWEHLKRDEIAGRMFDDELDLAYAIMNGLDARAQKSGYSCERFRFGVT